MKSSKFKYALAAGAVAFAAGAAVVFWIVRSASSGQDLTSLLRVRTTIDGRSVAWTADDTKVIIVNFWATWCGPCIQETPSLLKIAAADKSIRLISISEDDSVKDLKKFLNLYPSSQAANIFVIHDEDRRLAKSMGVTTYPTSYVYSKNFRNGQAINGAVDWESEEIRKLLQSASAANAN